MVAATRKHRSIRGEAGDADLSGERRSPRDAMGGAMGSGRVTGREGGTSAPAIPQVGKVLEEIELGDDPRRALAADGDQRRRTHGQEGERLVERR